MKAAVIGFTSSGCSYAEKIRSFFENRGDRCTAYGKCQTAAEFDVEVLSEKLQDWTGKRFADCDAIVFIGATGIAVRSIAPFVTSKLSDPAIICMDEQAKFVISLLSGHVGGANDLAEEIAEYLKSTPVVTTATDLHKKFAVDSYAKKAGLVFYEKELAKKISAEILEDTKIGLFSDFPVEGEIPEDLTMIRLGTPEEERPKLGICISLDESKCPFEETFHLIPKVTVLGVGCKRDTEKEKIASRIGDILREKHISEKSVALIASIDLKKDEKGLIGFAEDLKCPFVTYSAEELSKVDYEGAAESEFVKSITGVGNVCERSALLSSGEETLFLPKAAGDGVTLAIAIKQYKVHF